MKDVLIIIEDRYIAHGVQFEEQMYKYVLPWQGQENELSFVRHLGVNVNTCEVMAVMLIVSLFVLSSKPQAAS